MKTICLTILILLTAFIANATERKHESLSEYNYNSNITNDHTSIHSKPLLAPLPPKPMHLKGATDHPDYGLPKRKFIFNEDHLRAIDGLKLFAVQEVDKAISQLRHNQYCYLGDMNCNKKFKAKIKSRLTQFKKSNSIFRRLIAAYHYLGLSKEQITDVLDVHFLSNKILKQAGLRKLELTAYEYSYTKFVLSKSHAQINENWEVENKKFQEYMNYTHSSPKHRSNLTQPEGKITNLGPKRNNFYYQTNKLRSYYLYQITDLISKEPLLLFIDNPVVSKDSIAQAYERYISFLEQQKLNIKNYDNNEDLLSLIQMYRSLPEERQQLKLDNGNPFTDHLAWESLMYEVNRVLKNRKKFNSQVNLALMSAGASTFFMPTTHMFGMFLTSAWIVKGLIQIGKQNKLLKNDITFWLSGIQTYRSIIDRQSRIKSEAIMIGFFGFALSPSITRVASAERDFFTLKAEEVDTFLTNIIEYGKARLKWKSKGGIANSSDYEKDIFDIYLKTEGNMNFYIPSIVIDFNDYKVLNSGCLLSTEVSCLY